MDLIRTGNYVLSSGKKSRYKIHCETLSDDSMNSIAWLISKLVGPFSSVEGIPSGGTRLEQILKHLVDKNKEGPHLIVDDVLTSGESMSETRREFERHSYKYVVGAVIFARGPLPGWIKAVCSLPKELWEL